MVKADPKHDYYADLDCKPNAEPNDLRKAYKKLAFQYHPDRNPGNEEEASHKFQEISYAYDMLNDPERRAKYDADRLRQTLQTMRAPEGNTNSPPRSPFPVYTGFPPPPRRTQQHQPPPAPPPRGQHGTAPTAKQPPSGASRYAAFTARPYNQSRDDQAKAQAYTAWEQMKHRGAQAPPQPPPRHPPRPNSFVVPGTATSKQKAGWEDTPPPKQAPGPEAYANGAPNMARPGPHPALGKSPKRRDFFPAPEVADEPPSARYQSAYAGMRGGRPPPAPPRPQSQYAPNAPPASGFRHVNPQSVPVFKGPAPDGQLGDRTSAPYATGPGERTYFNSENLSRSASTAANLHAGWNDTRSREGSRSRPSARHRSASPHIHSPRPPEDYSSSEESDSTDEDVEEEAVREREKLQPKSRYSRRRSADDRANPRGPVTTQPHPKHPNITVEIDPDGEKRANGHRRAPSTGAPPPEGFQQHRMRVSPGRSPGPINTKPLWPGAVPEGKYAAAQNGRKFERPVTADVRSKSPGFFLPNESSGSGSSTKNSSTEHVDKRFSPTAWEDTFKDANTYLGAQKPARTNTSSSGRGRSPPKPRPATTGVSVPQKAASSDDTQPRAPVPPSTRSNGPVPAPEPLPPKFSKEEWARHFKEPSWAYPAGPAQSPGKGKPKTPRKNSVHSRKGATPRASVFSMQGHARQGSTVSEAAVSSSSEMAGKRTLSAHSIRSNGSAMDLDPPVEATPQSRSRQPSMSMKDDPIANIIRSAVPPTAKKETFGFDEFDDDPLAFEELKKVDPLAPSNQGLQSMGDLALTLPFESQASIDPAQQFGPRPRELPPLPTPPPPLTGDSFTKGSWEQYISTFEAYLGGWSMFNQRMINHFQARQNSVGELPRGWTTTANSEGITRCLAGIEEDFRVREHWDKGWANHRDNMVAFAKVKSRAAKLNVLEDEE